jgi:hypothetical protein
MQDHSYKLTSDVTGFLPLPSGRTMEVTIPAGSIVDILCMPSDGMGLTRVRYRNRSCLTNMEELQKLGMRMEPAPVGGAANQAH